MLVGLFFGLLIGVATGVVQYLMLAKFTNSVTNGTLSKKTAMFAVAQFLLPLAVLVGCALLIEGSILWAGVGITASLTTCALVRYFLTQKSSSRQ